jgi:AraC family transcriptional regulator of adaptative response/methylated-DNA-[protein]-cysteine methyltransferase
MPEQIHFSWGSSSLGDFMVAASDQGLVSFEFGERRPAMLDALRERFSDAAVEQDDIGLAGTVARLADLVDHPDQDPGIPLDLRGTDYQKQVWTMLREIPAGQTTSYGALAAKLGTRDARDVTGAIASNCIAILVPCHRVIKKDGSISGYGWGVRRKRALLDRERLP